MKIFNVKYGTVATLGDPLQVWQLFPSSNWGIYLIWFFTMSNYIKKSIFFFKNRFHIIGIQYIIIIYSVYFSLLHNLEPSHLLYFFIYPITTVVLVFAHNIAFKLLNFHYLFFFEAVKYYQQCFH